jgi:hypothetical protein
MSDQEYEESRRHELETFCARHFAKNIHVRKVLFDDMSVSHTASMTVFSTDDHSIFAVIETNGKDVLRLGDVERLVKDAGFSPSHYVAPDSHRSYFLQRAFNIFTSVYPSRTTWTPDQEAYYQLLVPYSPALVKLRGLRGPVRRYNTFSNTWQIVYELSNHIYASRSK